VKAKPLEFIAKHKTPFLIGGGVIVVFILARNLSGGSSSAAQTTAATATDPNAAQAAQTAAAFASQQDAEAFKLAYVNQAGAIQTQQQQDAITGSIQLANIQAANATNQSNNQLALGEAETQANVQIQQIQSNTLLGVAAIQGQTQQVESTNNTNAEIANANALQTIGLAQASAAQSAATGAEVGGILGGVGKLASAFF
jgi:hypothetical protein